MKNEKMWKKNNNLEHLVIDWKVDRIDQTIEILERNGYEIKGEYERDDIKTYIQTILNHCKNGTNPQRDEMSVIYSNIRRCDHHDLVRADQILTRVQNEKETEYQWGSVVMNFKMKIL